MENALKKAGKRPQSLLCPWYNGAATQESNSVLNRLQPSSEQPVVYHLWGGVHDPPSLVLTEEDHLEFAGNLIRDTEFSNFSTNMLPPVIRKALTQPLLIIGQSILNGHSDSS